MLTTFTQNLGLKSLCYNMLCATFTIVQFIALLLHFVGDYKVMNSMSFKDGFKTFKFHNDNDFANVVAIEDALHFGGCYTQCPIQDVYNMDENYYYYYYMAPYIIIT